MKLCMVLSLHFWCKPVAIVLLNGDETKVYLKPEAIIKERQICQTFQLNSAHLEFILQPPQEPFWFRSQALTIKANARTRDDEAQTALKSQSHSALNAFILFVSNLIGFLPCEHLVIGFRTVLRKIVEYS